MTVGAARTTGSALGRHEIVAAYTMLAPWIIGIVVFIIGPVIASLVLAFTEWDLLNPAALHRRGQLPRDAHHGRPDPQVAAEHRLLHLLRCALPAGGSAVDGRWPSTRTCRAYASSAPPSTCPLSPRPWPTPCSGCSSTAQTSASPTGSWARWTCPRSAGWPTRSVAKPAFIIMSLWGVGGTMVIYLAGLQGMPDHLYEAAGIDGAGTWNRFRNITLPMLTPTIFFTMIMGIIGSFQVFTGAFVMTQGGPNNATLFYVLHLYRNAFQYLRMGYASAMAWVLFMIIAAAHLRPVRHQRSLGLLRGGVAQLSALPRPSQQRSAHCDHRHCLGLREAGFAAPRTGLRQTLRSLRSTYCCWQSPSCCSVPLFYMFSTSLKLPAPSWPCRPSGSPTPSCGATTQRPSHAPIRHLSAQHPHDRRAGHTRHRC